MSNKNDLNNLNQILNNINGNQANLMTKIYQYIEDNVSIKNDIKRKNKIKMLGLLYATYLSTINTLEDKTITNDDLNILNSISNNNENNSKTNYFKTTIKSLENLYNTFKEKQDNINDININEYNTLLLIQRKSLLKKEERKTLYDNQPKMSTCIFCDLIKMKL